MMRTVADLVNALENDNTVFMITINGQTITEGKIVCDNVDELDWELDNEKCGVIVKIYCFLTLSRLSKV